MFFFLLRIQIENKKQSFGWSGGGGRVEGLARFWCK